MRINRIVTLASASAMTGVLAQDVFVTTTEYYSECSTATGGYTGTVTGTVTELCSACAMGATVNPKILTTYTTVMPGWCSTGLEAKTYTITEACTATGSARPSDHVPAGMYVVTQTCPVCTVATTAVLTIPTPASTADTTPGSTTLGITTSPTGASPPGYGTPYGSPGSGSTDRNGSTPISPPIVASGSTSVTALIQSSVVFAMLAYIAVVSFTS